MDRRPLFDAVPIPHGRFPIKAPVIRHILQEQALHLAGDLGPSLGVKRLALLGEELIKILVAVFGQVRRRAVHELHDARRAVGERRHLALRRRGGASVDRH